jgi:hypothetical protein
LGKLILGEPLHLVYLILLDQPFEICDWSFWSSIFQGLPAQRKLVAAAVGVDEG